MKSNSRPRVPLLHSAVCLLASACCLLTSAAFASVWSTDGTDSLLACLEDAEVSNVRIGADNTVRLAGRLAATGLLSGEDAAVWRVVRGRGPGIYVGTGHVARVFLGQETGPATLLHDGGDGEVMAMVMGPGGTVYFGTTPSGHVYRVRPGTTPETLAATGETYVFSLLPDPSGGLLCATGENGRLLRVSPTGDVQTVYTAGQANLTALTWLEPGKQLAVGTSPGGLACRLTFRPGYTEPLASVLYDTPLEEVRAIVPGPNGRLFIAANPAEDGDESGNPAVYCLDADGVLRWEWTCPDTVLFGLLWREEQLWVATGNQGLVYGIDTLGRASVLFRLEEPQVTCLCPVPGSGQLLLGTGNPGRVYSVGSGYADSGFVVSPAHDCVNPARFGRIETRADVPLGTDLQVDLRSGNSADPDSTWSGWSGSPPVARYVQWRARLHSGFPGLTPVLRRVDVYYASANRAPEVTSLEVAAPTETEARRGIAKPLRDVTWEASDPDSDSLVYELYIRPEGGSSWRRLGLDLHEARYELDTRMLPDGWYEARVVASDRPDRAAPAALGSERVGPAFPVDNAPPRVSGLAAAGGRLTFEATDALSAVSACRISVNAGDWVPAEPADGIFDSPAERFSVPVSLGPGGNTVAVWVSDAQGNSATAQAALR
ncbi:hypothetical protein FJY71_02220 [candidate division WOR-3 bacterium]|nr:hypothetical protein [candidate division WOR-3 bacterium]